MQDQHVLLVLFICFPKFELSLEGLHLFILLIIDIQMMDKSLVNIKFQTCILKNVQFLEAVENHIY